jgi:type I restriction enzyme S subunit
VSWPTAALGEVTQKIGSGSTPRGGGESYKAWGIPLIRSMNVHDGEFVDDGLAYLDDHQAAALKHVTLHVGDVLLNITGASVARVCRLPDQLSGGRVNQHVSIIRPDNRRLDTNFLAHLLRAPEAKARLLRVAGSGATREAITKAQIEEFKIPLPPLNEQRRIAAILDKADALRRKRKHALDLVDTLSQSIFLEMFGEPGLSKRFPQAPLSEIATKITDGEHQNPEFTNGGMPIVMASQVLDDGIDIREAKFVSHADGERFRRKCAPEKGDILIVGRGATIGRTSVVDTSTPFCLMGSVILLKPEAKLVDSTYLATLFKFPRTRAALYNTSGSSAQQAIYLSHLKKMSVLLPAIKDQREFAERAEKIAVGKSICFRNIKIIETLFLSLQHSAFSA